MGLNGFALVMIFLNGFAPVALVMMFFEWVCFSDDFFLNGLASVMIFFEWVCSSDDFFEWVCSGGSGDDVF